MADILPFTVFKLDINGDDLPFTLRPTIGLYGACVHRWTSDDDREFYTSFLSNLRIGTVICKVGETDVLFSGYDDIIEIIENYKTRPIELTMALRKSKWLLVKEQLHYIATVLKDRMNAGLSDEEIEMRRRNGLEYLKAAKMGSIEYVNMYTSMISIDRDFKDELGWTALHYAVGNGNVAVTKLLLKKNLDVFTQENNGMTPLHVAAFHGHATCVELLLQYKSSISGKLLNKVDSFGRTALHLCAISGNLEMVKTFYEMGADIYQIDKKDGWSPLHYAVQNGRSEMIQFLLHNGANIYRRTFSKKTTLHIAYENRRQSIINLLLEFLKKQPSHRILEIEKDPWLGNGDCEVWVGDRNSCNEERTKACDINCVISLLSARAMTKAPVQWIKYEYGIEHYHFECTYI